MSFITSRAWRRYRHRPPPAPDSDAAGETGAAAARDALLADYVHAEDALRAFTDQNFGRMCAMCARWTLLATQVNARSKPAPGQEGESPAAEPALEWRVRSWVTNCCNANHALESMSESSLAGIVASREAGKEWWRAVKRAQAAPCGALTDTGCHLTRGRPELCNRYFCEAVRDYLWMIGGDCAGKQLAERLDELQRQWTRLYQVYQDALVVAEHPPAAAHVRGLAGWQRFLRHLETFDAEIAACVRPISAEEVAEQLFKVAGAKEIYEPFFEREMASIGGWVRAPAAPAPPANGRGERGQPHKPRST